MTALKYLAFGLFFVAIIAGSLALSALLIMFFGNIILRYFEIRELSFGVSFAIAAVLGVLGGAFNRVTAVRNG